MATKRAQAGLANAAKTTFGDEELVQFLFGSHFWSFCGRIIIFGIKKNHFFSPGILLFKSNVCSFYCSSLAEFNAEIMFIFYQRYSFLKFAEGAWKYIESAFHFQKTVADLFRWMSRTEVFSIMKDKSRDIQF